MFMRLSYYEDVNQKANKLTIVVNSDQIVYLKEDGKLVMTTGNSFQLTQESATRLREIANI